MSGPKIGGRSAPLRKLPYRGKGCGRDDVSLVEILMKSSYLTHVLDAKGARAKGLHQRKTAVSVFS